MYFTILLFFVMRSYQFDGSIAAMALPNSGERMGDAGGGGRCWQMKWLIPLDYRQPQPTGHYTFKIEIFKSGTLR